MVKAVTDSTNNLCVGMCVVLNCKTKSCSKHQLDLREREACPSVTVFITHTERVFLITIPDTVGF